MTTTDIERTRTHAWDDPMATAAAAQGMSGLEFLETLARGELPPPPIMSTLGYEGLEVGPGWARFTLTPGVSYQVADDAEAHRSSSRSGATLFVVD